MGARTRQKCRCCVSNLEATGPSLECEGEPRAIDPAGELERREATPKSKFRQQLRTYQADVVGRVDVEVQAGRRRVLVVAPTGSGKTVIATEIVAVQCRAGRRVLFLVHRRELLQQASRKLHGAGIDHGIIAAGFPSRPSESVQLGSISTLHARAVRSSAMTLPEADVIIVDGGPFLGAASTVQFAHIADAVVLTIPAGRQQKQALALIGRELREQQPNVLAVTTPSAPPHRR